MFKITNLENGLKIITHEQPGIESIYVDISVLSGSKFCPSGKEGLAHFVEHMVMNGNKNYPTGLDVTRAINEVGGNNGASTWKELVDYWFKVLADDLNIAAKVIFPLVTAPLLSKEELEGERKIILEEISRAQDLLERKVSDALFRLVFKGHQLGHPGLGYPETLKKITHPDIASFVKNFYIPENIVISASGCLSHDVFVDLVRRHFGETGNLKSPVYSMFTYQRFGPKATILTDESKQAKLLLAFPNPPKTLRDHVTERVLTSLLSSRDRLHARLREREHLAYEVGMRRFRARDLSLISVAGGFTYAEVSKTVSIICEELKRVKDDKIPEEEFNKVKKIIEVDLLFSLESPEEWSDFILDWNHFLGDPIEPKQFLDELGSISVEDIQSLAQEIFVPENAYLSVSHRDIGAKTLEDLILTGLG